MAVQPVTPDPIRQINIAKRWAQAGIFTSVGVLIGFYWLALGLSAIDLTLVLVPAAFVAFIAIEIATRWEARMHKRYYYPQQLGYQLAKIHDFEKACDVSVRLVGDWLGLPAAVIGWFDDDDETLRAVAAFGMPEGWIEVAATQRLSDNGLRGVQDRNMIRVECAHDAWFRDFSYRDIVYVPLVSRDYVEGVLVIPVGKSASVRDEPLLASIGVVMGLALDNCRLYEGERAHAQHFQELNRMKSDFLTTVSHELRTPLTSIMMGAEMLLEEEETRDPNSTRGKLVRNIVKGASRLSHLVSDLVNVSREDDFQPRLEIDTAPLKDLVHGAVSVVGPLLGAKGQTIEVDLMDPGALVLVDRLRFEQVLINLLSNAQRYSPPGGHIVVEARPISNGETLIAVADCGPGVARDDCERIFEPFYRGDRNGLGLGLAIAKSIVELHSGRIWVEPGLEGGSRFCVAIPGQNSRVRRSVDIRSPLHAGRRN